MVSTGKLFAQIENGAPLTCFKGRRTVRARKWLENSGSAVSGSRFLPYARGKMWRYGSGDQRVQATPQAGWPALDFKRLAHRQSENRALLTWPRSRLLKKPDLVGCLQPRSGVRGGTQLHKPFSFVATSNAQGRLLCAVSGDGLAKQ